MHRNILFSTSEIMAFVLMAAGAHYDNNHKFKHWGWNSDDCIVMCGCNDLTLIRSIIKVVARKVGITILSEDQFLALQPSKCKNIYIHSFYLYSERVNNAISDLEFDEVILYADGVKNQIHPVNISAKMNINRVLYFGWIDASGFGNQNDFDVSLVPWIALRKIYEIAGSFIEKESLASIGMSTLRKSDFLLIQRYYGKGIYSFKTETDRQEFAQLLAYELYKISPSNSIIVYPDYRCSLEYNKACSTALKKYYTSVDSVLASEDQREILNGMPIESILMALSPEQLPQKAFGYDSGTSLILKGISLADYGYYNVDPSLFKCFKAEEAGKTVKYHTNRYKMIYEALSALPSFSSKCIVLRNGSVVVESLPYHSCGA